MSERNPASFKPRRRVVAGLGLVLVAALVGSLAWVPQVGAAIAPRDRVYPSYLPTVVQVSRIYPYLADGTRHTVKTLGSGGSFSCWNYDPFQAAGGRFSFYSLKGGPGPYFRGLEDPAAFVYKFHTRRQALDAFWLQQRFVHDCMGRKSADGTTQWRRTQRVPFLGQGSVAYRLRERHETSSGFGQTRELHIFVRRGRYVVNIFNQARDFQPDTGNGVRLARVTLRNIG
ncbi:MAG: hypothetical protein OEW41_04065 [Actinomycetota bacterium]|nr:hypothetical protein [Actinomycetota bacterium]